MSCDQALDKLSEKLNSRLLVQEEHGFQKGGAQCAPLAAGAQKKPGLDRVKQEIRASLKMSARKQVLPQQLRKNREVVPHTHLVHRTPYPKPHITMHALEL